MYKLPSWEVLLKAVGKNLEDASKLLQDRNTDLSIKDLQNLRDTLRVQADSLDARIIALQEEG